MEKYPATADGLMAVLKRLRAPGGCPWDRKQTRQTLSRCLAEECAELLEAIDNNNIPAIKDELGDLLMNAVFQAEIAEENGEFTLEDVWQNIIDKMIRRHVHVFGDAHADTPEEVLELWGKVKEKEKSPGAGTEQAVPPSALDGVPPTLCALSRGEKLQKKAAKIGFDWPDASGAFAKIMEEAAELQEAYQTDPDSPLVEEELGDLLFAAVNFARLKEGMTAEEIMRKANRKFEERFRKMEDFMHRNGESPATAGLKRLDEVWDMVKKEEKKNA